MVTEHDHVQDAKERQRAASRARLSGMDAATRSVASESIRTQLMHLVEAIAPTTVLGYLPLSDEPDIQPALQMMLDQGMVVAVPRIINGGGMEAARLTSLRDGDLIKGAHGVLTTGNSDIVAMDAIGLILVPGVAFDDAGRRLGRGGGYYDRFLSDVAEDVVTVGCCFQCQIFSRIETGPQDVPVSKMLVEEPGR